MKNLVKIAAVAAALMMSPSEAVAWDSHADEPHGDWIRPSHLVHAEVWDVHLDDGWLPGHPWPAEHRHSAPENADLVHSWVEGPKAAPHERDARAEVWKHLG